MLCRVTEVEFEAGRGDRTNIVVVTTTPALSLLGALLKHINVAEYIKEEDEQQGRKRL